MKAALLVLDFINEIADEKGKTPAWAEFIHQNHVIEKANKAIALSRQHGLAIIFVKVGFTENYPQCPVNSPVFSKAPTYQAYQLGSWGCEFHKDLDYQKTDSVVIKHRISPFYATALEAYLRAGNIDTIFITGVSTNNAVQACARDAHDRDYRVFVLEDACAAKNQAIQDAALLLIKDLAQVIKVSEFETLLQ